MFLCMFVCMLCDQWRGWWRCQEVRRCQPCIDLPAADTLFWCACLRDLLTCRMWLLLEVKVTWASKGCRHLVSNQARCTFPPLCILAGREPVTSRSLTPPNEQLWKNCEIDCPLPSTPLPVQGVELMLELNHAVWILCRHGRQALVQRGR